MQVLPGDSILSEDIHQELCHKRRNVLLSSSSSDESDIMPIIDESDSGSEVYGSDDSEYVDNQHADEAQPANLIKLSTTLVILL